MWACSPLLRPCQHLTMIARPAALSSTPQVGLVSLLASLPAEASLPHRLGYGRCHHTRRALGYFPPQHRLPRQPAEIAEIEAPTERFVSHLGETELDRGRHQLVGERPRTFLFPHLNGTRDWSWHAIAPEATSARTIPPPNVPVACHVLPFSSILSDRQIRPRVIRLLKKGGQAVISRTRRETRLSRIIHGVSPAAHITLHANKLCFIPSKALCLGRSTTTPFASSWTCHPCHRL